MFDFSGTSIIAVLTFVKWVSHFLISILLDIPWLWRNSWFVNCIDFSYSVNVLLTHEFSKYLLISVYCCLIIFNWLFVYALRVTIMKDKDTRKSKGVAFILFLDKDSAQNCTRAINNKQVSHSFPTRFLIQKPLLIQAKNVGIQWMIKSWISIDFEGI